MPLSSIDTTALNGFIGQYDRRIAQEVLVGSEFYDKVTVDTQVKSSKKYTKRAVISNARPFDSTFDGTGNKIKYTQRGIEVNVLRDDYPMTNEDFRKTWIGEEYDLTGGENPDYQGQLTHIVEKLMTDLSSNIVWFADTTLPLTTAARYRQADGWGKQMKDAVVNAATTGIIVVATGVLTGGSGNGYQGTIGNALSSLQKMDLLSPLHDAGVARFAYMSYPTYNKVVRDIKANMTGDPKEEALKSDGPLGRYIYIEESDGLLALMPCRFMKNSQRIWIGQKENIIFGTDTGLPQFGMFDTQKITHGLNVSAKLVYGMTFRDYENIVCNELV
jgi:hypothetical protein